MHTEEIISDEKIFMKNVTYLRELHGLSRTKMAKLLHISIKSLDMMERGELPKHLSSAIFFYIEENFNIPPVKQFTKLWT